MILIENLLSRLTNALDTVYHTQAMECHTGTMEYVQAVIR